MTVFEFILSSFWLTLGTAICLVIVTFCFSDIVYSLVKNRAKVCGRCNGGGIVFWVKTDGKMTQNENGVVCPECNGVGKKY